MRRSINLTEWIKLEYHFMMVPIKRLRSMVEDNHHIVVEDVSSLLSIIKQLSDGSGDGSGDSSGSGAELDASSVLEKLTSILTGIDGLKQKVKESSRNEWLQVQKCEVRIKHLETADASYRNHIRMMRILVDYMARMAYNETAAKIIETNDMQELVDIDPLSELKSLLYAVKNKELGLPLKWCAENSLRLSKSKGNLELKMRIQEFIELVRVGDYMSALMYAQEHFARWAATDMKQLQRVLATLIFERNHELADYKDLFASQRWDDLFEQMKQEFCRLHGITLEPLLKIYMQAGLIAFKTPFWKLASTLPQLIPHKSELLCSMTKKAMDSNNPPLALPNGYVYSTKALEEMATAHDGNIICPKTGFICNFHELLKIYI